MRHPSSTYLFRVAGHGWANQGIFGGDVAVIDRAVSATASGLVIAWRLGDSTILRRNQLTPDDQLWGVVTAIIHQYH